MDARRNVWLLVEPGVVLSPVIESVICDLDNYFENAGVPAYVTSGVRTAEKQLEIIIEKAKRHGLFNEFEEIRGATLEGKIVAGGEEVYVWQRAWSRLLCFGDMVNPPKPAKCLFDYKRGNVLVPAGTMKDISVHMKGLAFDIGGGKGKLELVGKVIESAVGNVQGLKGYLVEKINNAVHVDCWKAV